MGRVRERLCWLGSCLREHRAGCIAAVFVYPGLVGDDKGGCGDASYQEYSLSHTSSSAASNRPSARWPSACTSILCRVCSDPNQPRNTHTHTSEGGRDDRWVPYHAETQETRQGAKGNSRTAFAAPTGMEPQLGRSRSMRSAAAVRQRAILVFKLSLSLSYILDADILEQAPSSSLDSARRCARRLVF